MQPMLNDTPVDSAANDGTDRSSKVIYLFVYHFLYSLSIYSLISLSILCSNSNFSLFYVYFQLHKAWLARRSGTLKTLSPQPINETTLNRITYLRKLIKFNKNTNEPISENDVSYVPHNLSEEKDKQIRVNPSDSSNSSINNRYDIYNVVSSSTYETPLEKTDAVIEIVNKKDDEITSSTAKTGATTQLDNNIPNYDATTSTEGEPVETSTIENSLERVPEMENVVKKSAEKQEEMEAVKAEDLSIKSVFTSWSGWSLCSRPCGGGVKSQSRKCVKRT